MLSYTLAPQHELTLERNDELEREVDPNYEQGTRDRNSNSFELMRIPDFMPDLDMELRWLEAQVDAAYEQSQRLVIKGLILQIRSRDAVNGIFPDAEDRQDNLYKTEPVCHSYATRR